jgi:hypothetical protein
MSRANLLTLQRELEDDHALPSPEIRDWLLEGIGAFVETGGRVSLCRCLGLRGAGVRSLEYELARVERDVFLREAFERMPRYGDESPTAVADRLATMISRFESVTWPRIRHHEDPPRHLDDVQQALFHAFRHGSDCGGVPRSGRHLRELVR